MVSYRELTSFIWQFMRNQKWRFFSILVQDCLNCLDLLLWPFLLRWVIDIFTQYEGNRMLAWDALRAPLIGAICLIVLIEINSRTMGLLLAKAIPQLQADLRLSLFDHIQHHSPHYFNERFAGSLANKITDITTQVDTILQQLFWPLIPSLVASLLGALFLWFVSPILACFLALWVVLHVGVCIIFSKSCDIYEHRHGECRTTLLGKIVDSLTNNFAVNLFYRFRYEKNALLPFQEAELSSHIFAKQYVEKMRFVTSIFYTTVCFLGINGTMIYLWLHHHLSTGEVAQVFGTLWNIANIMWGVGGSLPVFFQSFGIAKQAYSVMLDPQDIGDKPTAKPLKVGSGEIIFDKVSFHYGEKHLFKNKEVHIRGGEKVGLVGFTG